MLLRRTSFFREKNLANVFLIVIPSRNISSAIYLAQKLKFKVFNICRSLDLPPLRFDLVDHATWRHSCGTRNADYSSSSDSATSSSDYLVVECEASESKGQPFTGIQPWRFEPPERSSEAEEVRESPENIEPVTACHSPAAISIVKNGECLDRIEQLLRTMWSAYHLISSMLWMIRILKGKELIKQAFFWYTERL